MFDGDVSALSLTDLLVSAGEHQVERHRCEARLLLHAACFADLTILNTNVDSSAGAGRERLMVYGGEGCPAIPEFAAAEFGAMIGISAGAAAHYIGQALALRHRLPFTWARVLAGEAIPWRACKIADACKSLSAEAAAIVDKRVCSVIDTVTPQRLARIVKSAVYEADPAAAQAAAEQKAREHGVYVSQSDEHGSKTIWVRAEAGAVIRFDATIEQIAEALKVLGDTASLASRRAKAIGIIADPCFTEELLLEARNTPPAPQATPEPGPDARAEQGAMEPEPVHPGSEREDAARRALGARLAQIKLDSHSRARGTTAGTRPRQTEVYVHLTDRTLATGTGVVRVEDLGPMLAGQLADLVGYGPYCVKPVIDLNDNHAISVDAYEIPDRIRERVKLIHPVEQFPYGTAESSLHIDLDHIEPYDPAGPPGQTRIDNLAPLRRFTHRVKTHGNWAARRLDPTTLEWTTPHGFKFRVTPDGTRFIP
ncbi:DUF222 domain-containing protein [Streptomyces sp. SID13031]|uniref:DUF222 domain-containing protein n=1 Tax=Streptomyces sp. SID13031 TaxID=2706046 RepID=UPI0013CC7A2C|nr:DUF222 domain-containing protein [Streptomyces sp. SID13031]NEA35253.1 DUF222 domain-containing protein [Streptomyces sp. SID13031]